MVVTISATLTTAVTKFINPTDLIILAQCVIHIVICVIDILCIHLWTNIWSPRLDANLFRSGLRFLSVPDAIGACTDDSRSNEPCKDGELSSQLIAGRITAFHQSSLR